MDDKYWTTEKLWRTSDWWDKSERGGRRQIRSIFVAWASRQWLMLDWEWPSSQLHDPAPPLAIDGWTIVGTWPRGSQSKDQSLSICEEEGAYLWEVWTGKYRGLGRHKRTKKSKEWEARGQTWCWAPGLPLTAEVRMKATAGHWGQPDALKSSLKSRVFFQCPLCGIWLYHGPPVH